MERAVQLYGSMEVLYHDQGAGEAPRRARGLGGMCTPELVVFRHGRDYRFRGPGLPTQEDLVSDMRSPKPQPKPTPKPTPKPKTKPKPKPEPKPIPIPKGEQHAQP